MPKGGLKAYSLGLGVTLKSSIQHLQDIGIAKLKLAQHIFDMDPERDSAILMAFLLKMSLKEYQLYSLVHKKEFDGYQLSNLDPKIIEEYNRLIDQRITGTPIAYITESKEFWSLKFKVTPATLIPRPDTETLIEASLDLFSKSAKMNILDLGTGSGAILLSLLSEFPNASGVGVDVCSKALEIAQENAKNLGLASRSQFIQSNWFEKVSGKYNLIVSNPPYISEQEYTRLDITVKNFEPQKALVGGKDGLECYRMISSSARNHLIPKEGFLALEIGSTQAIQVQKNFESKGLQFVKTRRDLSGLDRCIVFSA